MEGIGVEVVSPSALTTDTNSATLMLMLSSSWLWGSRKLVTMLLRVLMVLVGVTEAGDDVVASVDGGCAVFSAAPPVGTAYLP